ncbi:MAG: 4-hydroxy-3-methylbut-2-enyl diphosphate reductase [Desulfuromonadia bacterium]
MEIVVGRHAGFCFGVKRATRLAFETAEREGRGATLGPIIHSPQVVRELEEKGVRVVDSLDQVTDETVILRSHGVTASELNWAKERGLKVVDATCPFVRKAQEHVASLSREGYGVVVVGETDHPEVRGIVSYGSSDLHVVSTPEEAERIPRMKRTGIVAQTTQTHETFLSIVSVMVRRSYETRVFNTICDATKVRQDEAKELARTSDCMIVVGGFESGNTRRLAQICGEICPNTHHIESVDQLDPEWFRGCSRVGVTAGASTPGWVIDEVVDALKIVDKSREKG